MVRNGKANGKQRYYCKGCHHQFFDNGKFPRMRKPKAIVAAALRLYFDGASLPKTARSIRSILGVTVNWRNIHRWIEKYVPQVDGLLGNYVPHLSGVWHSDETTLRFRPSKPLSEWHRAHKVRRLGEDWWQWDAEDEGTRFIIGTRISKTRTYKEGLPPRLRRPGAKALGDSHGQSASVSTHRPKGLLLKEARGAREAHALRERVQAEPKD